MERAKDFRDLLVWQKAHAFVLGVYKYTNDFPKSEVYGLSSQFRRAAVVCESIDFLYFAITFRGSKLLTLLRGP